MSSPVVDTVRTIPLKIEREFNPTDNDISGYPFERNSDRDGYFRSQLDDIAKRHPEFAEHLGNFQQRGTSQGRTSTEDPDSNRRFTSPFGERFERFGFPFDRDDFDPEEYAKQFYQSRQEFPHQHPTYQHSSHQQQPTHHQPQPTYQQEQPTYNQESQYHQRQQQQEPVSQTQTAADPVPTQERERSNIQQSNTIDLGQKQEPVNDRNQRSMSAPPAEKGQRYTSNIHIPVNQPSQTENMSHPQTQPEAKATERIIPIHIEGRDEPVLPKNAPSSYSQPHHSHTGPQPERIFGQRPENFIQFIHREPRQFSENWASFPEEPIRQQRFQTQHEVPHFQKQHRPAQTQKEEIPIPVYKAHESAKQQQQRDPSPQARQEQHKPPPQPHKTLTPIEQIQVIQKDVSALMEQVDNFDGKPKDKQYLYLDEMLTRNLLKLDDIDTQGQENIRSARKEAIKCIEKTLSVLEAKAAARVATPPAPEDIKMEVDEKSQEPVELKEQEETENKELPMEMQPEQTQNVENIPMETEVVAANIEDKANEESQAMELISESSKNTQSEIIPEHIEEKADNLTDIKPEPIETCEGQESNMAVADAVKKFEGSEENKNQKVVDSDCETKSSNIEAEKKENSEEKKEKAEEKNEKIEEKKEKKKGKKKVEKKEK